MAKNKNMTLVSEAPQPDAGRKEQASPLAKPRTEQKGDINAKEEGTDRVWGVSSRARWDRDRDHAQLMRDSRNVDRVIKGEELVDEEEQEEEGEEAVDPSTLKVAELKEALTEAGVEFDASAKKDVLVQLYIDNNVGGEEEEGEDDPE